MSTVYQRWLEQGREDPDLTRELEEIREDAGDFPGIGKRTDVRPSAPLRRGGYCGIIRIRKDGREGKICSVPIAAIFSCLSSIHRL